MPTPALRPISRTAPSPAGPVLPLTPRQLARSLAARPRVWRPLVRFTEPRYHVRLAVGPHWEAWLLTWLPGQSTLLHDHGGSAGAFTVLGGLVDEAIPLRGHLLTRRYRTGKIRSFGPDHVHDVANHSRRTAVTLHVYTPRLTTMTRYVLTDGELVATCVEREGEDW
jgi:quercetin dioxygenase-like cupin family protein